MQWMFQEFNALECRCNTLCIWLQWEDILLSTHCRTLKESSYALPYACGTSVFEGTFPSTLLTLEIAVGLQVQLGSQHPMWCPCNIPIRQCSSGGHIIMTTTLWLSNAENECLDYMTDINCKHSLLTGSGSHGIQTCRKQSYELWEDLRNGTP